MKIFNEEEVDKASLQYSTLIHSTDELDSIEAEAFAAGVEYAESKVEDLCIEFVVWCFDNVVYHDSKSYYIESEQYNKEFTNKELFQEFLKERNGK